MDIYQKVVIIILILLGINYLTIVFMDRLLKETSPPLNESFNEGFEDTSTMAKSSQIAIMGNEELYDNFYATTYDKLAQGIERTSAKVALILTQWKNWGSTHTQLRILDAGCGTGVAVASFAKLDVAHIIGLDLSEAMLRQAKNITIPATTLTDKQKDSIEWREGNLLDSSALASSEVDAAIVLYFTIYYIKDLDAFFRNMSVWVAPGGHMVVEVVNKYKFDPILDSANPWAGFSPQKYAEKRHTKSKVTFDEFDYEAEFILDPHTKNTNNDTTITSTKAEFRENFTFKDGSKRKHTHSFNMPEIKKIVSSATYAGWTYKAYLDTTSLGFEYGYLLFFSH